MINAPLRLTMADEIRWEPDFTEDRPETADLLLMTEPETRDYARLLQQHCATYRGIAQQLMTALAEQTVQRRVLESRLRHAHLRIIELERGSTESARGQR